MGYLSQLAPKVGNGLGGIPKRKEAAVQVVSKAAAIPKLMPSQRWAPDRGLSMRIPYNEVLWGLHGSYAASSPYRSSWYAAPKSGRPPFVFSSDETGGNSGWPSATQPSAVQTHFVSVTLGGEANYDTTTKIYGFSKDYLYRAVSTVSSSSVLIGFMLEDPDGDVYVFDNACVVYRQPKNSTTVATYRYYSSGGTPLLAWINGQNLCFITNSNPSKLYVVDKVSLELVTCHSLMIQAANTSNTVQHGQSSRYAGFFSTDKAQAVVIDKTTLEVGYHSIQWDYQSTRAMSMFPVGESLCIITYDYNPNTYSHAGYLVELTNSTYKYRASIGGGSWSNYLCMNTHAYLSADTVTVSNLNTSSQQIASTMVDLTFPLTEVPSMALNGVVVNPYSPSGANTPITKTLLGVTVNQAMGPSFSAFTRYPYVTY